MATQRHVTLQQRAAEGGFSEGSESEVRAFVDSQVKQEAKSVLRQRMEAVLWLCAGAVILWYGDGNRDFIYVVLHDPKLIQQPFFVACLCCLVNACIWFYLGVWLRHVRRREESFAMLAPGAIESATMLGFLAFGLFSYAMWPIWNIYIVPRLYVLFMDLVAIAPLLPPYKWKSRVV